MKKFLLSASLILMSVTGWAAPALKQPAPDFSVKGSDGELHKLSDYKNKYVVLEWWNKDCPYVKKHYGSGNMQALQNKFTTAGVVWLTVLSSAEGKQGFMPAADITKHMAAVNGKPTTVLLDPKGEVGRAYGAKTTPHMFIIDPTGKLIYMGAIDNKKSADQADIKTSTNYVQEVLTLAMANKPMPNGMDLSTEPYGCHVKY